MISRATIAESSTRTKSLPAALYIRVSSQGQEDNYSLPTQEAACRAYAAEQGYEVAEVYSEIHTGAEMWERPQLTRLREAIKRREVGALVCYALDRLSRSQAHLAIIAEECNRAGVALLFATEEFDKSPAGEFMRSARAFLAEMEREKIRERTMRGRQARLASGKLPGQPRLLYGYRWRDESKAAYDLDPDTAPVVKRMFAMVLAGASLYTICKTFTEEGIPTAQGLYQWDDSTIARVLRNRSYLGEATAGHYRQVKNDRTGGTSLIRRPVEEHILLPDGLIPPIVDRQAFEAVQVQIQRNKDESVRNSQEPERFLLRCGFIFCGYCGQAAHGHRHQNRKGGKRRYYYRTTDCVPSRHKCGYAATIEAALIDRVVWQRVEIILRRPELIADELQRIRSNADQSDKIAAMGRARDEMTRKQRNLARQIAVIDDDEAAAPLVAEVRSLGRQKQQIDGEIAGLVALQERWEATQTQITNVLAWCRSLGANLGDLSYEEKRDVLTWLGVKVKLYQKDHTPRYEIVARVSLEDDVEASGTGEVQDSWRIVLRSMIGRPANAANVAISWTDQDDEATERRSPKMRQIEERYKIPLPRLLLERYQALGSHPQVARELGVPVGTIYYWFRKFGISLTRETA